MHSFTDTKADLLAAQPHVAYGLGIIKLNG